MGLVVSRPSLRLMRVFTCARHACGRRAAAFEALMAYPGGMQLGGGVNADNAAMYLGAGASHVVVTSWVFREGRLDRQRLAELVRPARWGLAAVERRRMCRAGAPGRVPESGLVPGSARGERSRRRVHQVSGEANPGCRAHGSAGTSALTHVSGCVGPGASCPGAGRYGHHGAHGKTLEVRQVEAADRERLVLDLSCRRKDDGRYYVVTDRWQRFSDLVVDAATLADLGAPPARARAAASSAVRSRVLCTGLHWDVAAQQGRAASRGSARRRPCAAVQPEQLRERNASHHAPVWAACMLAAQARKQLAGAGRLWKDRAQTQACEPTMQAAESQPLLHRA